jgi:hypothetical protein
MKQLSKLQEELQELNDAVARYPASLLLSEGCMSLWYDSFVDELADVQVMLNQFKPIFNGAVGARMDYKIKRQLSRIKKEKEREKGAGNED